MHALAEAVDLALFAQPATLSLLNITKKSAEVIVSLLCLKELAAIAKLLELALGSERTLFLVHKNSPDTNSFIFRENYMCRRMSLVPAHGSTG